MKVVWTKRAVLRLQASWTYIAETFYEEYATAFEEDIFQTVERIGRQPSIGVEAFPELARPELRKFLSAKRNFWVYYRIRRDVCEIMSIRHVRQNVMGLGNL